MRIKTLKQVIVQIRKDDPKSAINPSMLKTMIRNQMIACYMHGNRRIVDYDTLIVSINQLFQSPNLAKVRTIRNAIREAAAIYPDIGIGECGIRNQVRKGNIPYVQIGNRRYISMHIFDEPFHDNRSSASIRQNVMEQMESVLSAQTSVPKVRRLRI